jgi:hypothetical protein
MHQHGSGADHSFQRQRAPTQLYRVTYVNQHETVGDLGALGTWADQNTGRGYWIRGYRLDRSGNGLHSIVVPPGLAFTPREGDVVEVRESDDANVKPRVVGLHWSIGSHDDLFADPEEPASPVPVFLRLPRDRGELYAQAEHLLTYHPKVPRENLFRYRHVLGVFGERFRDLRPLGQGAGGLVGRMLAFPAFQALAKRFQKRAKEVEALAPYRDVKPGRFAYRVDPVYDHDGADFSLSAVQGTAQGAEYLAGRRADTTDRFPLPLETLDPRLTRLNDPTYLHDVPLGALSTAQVDPNDLDLPTPPAGDGVARSRDPHLTQPQGETPYSAYDEMVNESLRDRRVGALGGERAAQVDPSNVEEPHTPALEKRFKLGRMTLTLSDMHGDGRQLLVTLKDPADQSFTLVYDEGEGYTHGQVRVRDMLGNTLLLDSRLKEYSRVVLKDRAHQTVELFSDPEGNEFIFTRSAPRDEATGERGGAPALNRVHWTLLTSADPSALAARFKRLPAALSAFQSPGVYAGSRDGAQTVVTGTENVSGTLRGTQRWVDGETQVQFEQVLDLKAKTRVTKFEDRRRQVTFGQSVDLNAQSWSESLRNTVHEWTHAVDVASGTATSAAGLLGGPKAVLTLDKAQLLAQFGAQSVTLTAASAVVASAGSTVTVSPAGVALTGPLITANGRPL